MHYTYEEYNVVLEEKAYQKICPITKEGHCYGKKCMAWIIEYDSEKDVQDGYGRCGLLGPIETFQESE
ncbi:MAG: hypothetical protein HDR50_06740 [Desulfovibrio sp.]|uniref:hypothetical protein n=1 Tax=Desulfovibrio sp. TaxID=885 RepID=UPI001A6785DD|nr:hypothetical protein [Desulfovibrio sp.]MBD5417345.1 hypothetical protein [Desulfovibrio sp.]